MKHGFGLSPVFDLESWRWNEFILMTTPVKLDNKTTQRHTVLQASLLNAFIDICDFNVDLLTQ